ncbi:amidohydrolase [Shewanella khirikhana]|uniref:amidohydrolase n=1 Tax=Shewanella khirikhana TaxID=1965282 RepID=UPI0030D06C1B
MIKSSLSLSLSAALLSLGFAANAETNSMQDLSKLVLAESPVVVYTAKEFITMNPKAPRAEAIAVQDGRILAIGSKADVGKVAGSNARLDKSFNGMVVMPGFVEEHVHPVLAALTMNSKVISIEDWDAIDGFSPAVREPKEYAKRLSQAIEEYRQTNNGKRKAFVTWGYHHYMHGKDLSRSYLDKLAPDFPVVVWHRSCHEVFLNSAALKLAGIDAAFVDSQSAGAKKAIDLDRGHMYEQGFFSALDKLAPLMATPEIFKEGLEFSVNYYHQNGITTASEPGGVVSKPLQQLVNSVYSGESTPFNHYFVVDGKAMANSFGDDPAKMLAETERVMSWGEGRTRYLPKQVKLFSDGAIFSQLMQMKDGYSDGHHGEWIMDPTRFAKAFDAYWDAGYQLTIHNNGDAGFDMVLASLEQAMKRNPRKDHRAMLSHFGFARPEQVKRWIELGGIVSSNPYYVTALAGRYGTMGMRESEMPNMVPHGDVLKWGGSLSFHSDMPMAPAKPMQLVWAAVNRVTYEGDVVGPEHKVPLETALKAITLDAAYAIQQEHRVGSLEVGKDANLTIMEKSPFDVAPAELKDIRIWGTMLEGRLQPVGKQPKAAKADAGAGTGTAGEQLALQEDISDKLVSVLNHVH